MSHIDIDFDLNVLRVFEALHEEGGATRAALRLGLTQSAVSAALGRLRRIYNDPLFTRTGRGLAPTLRAQELKPVVSEALNKCRESLALGASLQARFQGRSVVVGMSDDFEIATGRRLIDALQQHAPGLRLTIRQTHSQRVADMLVERSLDLAIASGGFSVQRLSREPVGEGGYACLVDPAVHACGAAHPMSFADYADCDHVLISSGGFIGVVDEVLATKGRQRTVVAATTHFSALPYLLRGSNAVATLPVHAARAIAAMSGLRCLPCPMDMPRYPVELGWRTDALRDPVIADIRDVLSRELMACDWGGTWLSAMALEHG